MTPLGSIIIAAYDEEAVIGRTLALLSDVVRDGIARVVVVCNGCSDRTADIARSYPGVAVLEISQPSKTAALRAGDRVVGTGPRIYLDADVELTSRAAGETLRTLAAGKVAGRPPRRFDTRGADWVVRRWYAVRERLSSIEKTLWGAGCYALSEEGRARFHEFPEVIADDLIIDSLFHAEEVTIVPTDPVVIYTPRRTLDLLRVLRRRYRSMRPEHMGPGGELNLASCQQKSPGLGVDAPISPGQRKQLRELRSLVRHEPRCIVDVGVYVVVVIVARTWASFGAAPRWDRDNSSRSL